jgi:hypothetical protein
MELSWAFAPDGSEHYQLKGREARNSIMGRLTCWPRSAAAAANVCDFYGDFLRYRESSALASSLYEIQLQHDPVALRHAYIQLQLGTDRTAEALSHEILHLSIRMQGYPIGEAVCVPEELDRYAGHVLGIHRVVGNLVEHELISGAFVALGFEKGRFLRPIQPAPDYRDLASRARPSLGYVEEVGFAWWCLEYFRNWISGRHWLGSKAHANAEMALHWGSQVHSDIPQTASQIRGLIESGCLLDREEHSRHFNRLLGLMRLPAFTEWVTIQPGDDTLVVIRL